MSQRRRNAKGKTPGASSFDGQREAVCMKAHGLVGVGVLPSCGGGRSVPGHRAGEGLAGCAEHGVMNTRAAEAPWTRDPGRQPRCRWSRFGLAVPQALRREVRAPAGDHWGSSPDWGSSPGRVAAAGVPSGRAGGGWVGGPSLWWLLLPCALGPAGEECGGARARACAGGLPVGACPSLAGAAGHAGRFSVVVSELARPLDDHLASWPGWVGIVLHPYLRGNLPNLGAGAWRGREARRRAPPRVTARRSLPASGQRSSEARRREPHTGYGEALVTGQRPAQ